MGLAGKQWVRAGLAGGVLKQYRGNLLARVEQAFDDADHVARNEDLAMGMRYPDEVAEGGCRAAPPAHLVDHLGVLPGPGAAHVADVGALQSRRPTRPSTSLRAQSSAQHLPSA